MKRITLSLVLTLGLAVAGCSLRGDPQAKTPAPPAPSAARPAQAETRPADSAGELLSIPQTQVRLPKAQPIDPEALATQPVMLPDPPPVKTTARPLRRPPTAAQAKPEPPDATADTTHPAETQRARIEPLLPADERRQLIEETDKRLRQAEEMVDRLSLRPLNNEQRSAVDRIRSFTKQSRQALDRSETQQAVELADRALLLAQELERAK